MHSNHDDEEPRKPSETILKQEIETGLAVLQRPPERLFLSSLSAGLDVGFSVLLMGVVYTSFEGAVNPALTRLAAATAYSVGFILVILGRSELFTEHTALAVLPVLDRRASISDLARLWIVVFAGNILGALLLAALLQWLAPALGAVEPWAFSKVAEQMVDHAWWVIVLSAVLAGWLMGELAGWLPRRETPSVRWPACG